MNKTKRLRKEYHVNAKKFLDLVTTLYDAIGIINEKRGPGYIKAEEYGLDAFAKYSEKAANASNPSKEDLDRLYVATCAAESVLKELEEVFMDDLKELYHPWNQQTEIISLDEAELPTSQKPSNRLLSRQYHGSVCNLNGDEI